MQKFHLHGKLLLILWALNFCQFGPSFCHVCLRHMLFEIQLLFDCLGGETDESLFLRIFFSSHHLCFPVIQFVFCKVNWYSGVNLGNIYILGIISIMWSDCYSKKLIGWEISGTQNIQ